MLAVAEMPGLIELLVSVSCAVTPNVATPELIVAAGEIAVTLPSKAWVEPAVDAACYETQPEDFSALMPAWRAMWPEFFPEK